MLTTPWAAPIEKPGPCSESAATLACTSASIVLGGVAQEHAELVAAHPVGGAVGGDDRPQLVAEARQQGVAGGVAEGVVVALEAVEVVQHELPRLARARRGGRRR